MKSNTIKKKKWLVFLSALVILFLLPLFSFALNITPVRHEIKGVPGEIYEGSFTVYNETQEKMYILVKLKKWRELKENSDIKPEDWVEIYPEEFDIVPGENKEVKFKVTVPKKAQGFVMTHVSFCPEVKQGGSVGMVMSLPIYVTIEGTEVFKAEISDVGLIKDKTDLQVMVVVKNDGNVYIRPKGKVTIKRKKKEITSINLKYGRPVYPGQVRGYSGDWREAELASGKYKLTAMVNYGSTTLEKTMVFKIDKKGNIVLKK